MRIYVASGLENRARVKLVIERIKSLGHEIAYDWTAHGDVRDKGEERMCEVSSSEVNGVSSADLVLLLLPGGKGTHIELGISLATRANKRILLWSQTGDELRGGSATCVFYHHPSIERITCSFEELMEKMNQLLS